MSDAAALVAAVEADPDSDLPRLVWADWLDDRGESTRAELVRVQCEAALRPSERLTARQAELLEVLSASWPADLIGQWMPSDLFPEERTPFDQYRQHFRRGVLTRLMPDAAEFLDRVAAYHDHGEPTVDLTLWHYPRSPAPADGWLPGLVASPLLRLVRAVGGRVPAGVYESTHLSRLETAVVDSLAAVRGLALSPSGFTLRTLNVLDGGAIDPGELVGLLAGSARFAGLARLTLAMPGLDSRHLRVLVGSSHLPPTLRLSVEHPSRHPGRRSSVGRALAARFPGPDASV